METLDDIRSRLSPTLPELNAVDILKIEAEGLEPEIILGASEFIKNCRWVVVDGGPERGLEEETTIEKCTNLLIQQKFSLVSLNLRNRLGVGLFLNERFSSHGLHS